MCPHKPGKTLQVRNSYESVLWLVVAASEITAMLQSSRDERAVIGGENCSGVASGVRPMDVISSK